MARVGSFRQRSRGGTNNLTSLIASLLREQQARRDQNIFDAYKNGGLFEGKPVTDATLLKYITDRRNSYDKGDPTYDQWNNTLIQSKFSIGEQKIGLAYKQGKVSAGAVASFYEGQLKSIPKDSAFYRDVAGRAAEWAKAGVSAARSAGRSRATAGLNARLAKSQGDAALFDAATAAIEQVAKRAGLIHGTQTWQDANANGLIDLLNQVGMKLPDGQKLTYAVWQGLAVKRAAAYDTEIALKDQAGVGTKTLRKDRAKFVGTTLGDLNALDERGQYETLHQKFADDVTAAKNDPRRLIDISNEYAASLEGLMKKVDSQTGNNTVSPDFRGALVNEITGLRTGKVNGPSPWDLFEPNSNGTNVKGESNTTHDLQSTVEGLYGAGDGKQLGAYAYADGLANGTMYYGQTKYGDVFAVHPYDPSSPGGLDVSQTTSVVRNADGEPTAVVLAGKPVEAARYTDQNGNPIDVTKYTQAELQSAIFQGTVVKDKSTTVGYVYTNPDTPNVHTYGVYNGQGKLVYTNDNPFTGLTAPDGTFVMGADGPKTVINAAPFAQAQPGQAATTSVPLSPDLTPDQILKAGHDLLAAGQTDAGTELVNLGVSQQGYGHTATILAANADNQYGPSQQQLYNRNISEATDRNPASALVVHQQTYLSAPPQANSGQFPGYYNPSLLPAALKPPTTPSPVQQQPTIKVPTVKLPLAPPPIVSGQSTGDISYKTPPPPVIDTTGGATKVGGKYAI